MQGFALVVGKPCELSVRVAPGHNLPQRLRYDRVSCFFIQTVALDKILLRHLGRRRAVFFMLAVEFVPLS